MTQHRDQRTPATIVDVARRAGVSRATAARALGSYGSVRPSTAEAVQRAAAEVGYRANALARSMITGRTGTIGIVLADIENQFFVQALRGISHVARTAGYDLLLANTEEDVDLERAAIEVMSSRQVEGLLVCPANPHASPHLITMTAGKPLVLLDRTIAQLEADVVGIDNRHAGYEATRRLVELGHRRIGLISGVGRSTILDCFGRPEGPAPAGETPSEGRIVGYCQALREVGVEPDIRWSGTAGFHREDAYAAAAELLAGPDRPTAIMASDSIQTLGALQAIRAAGLTIPDDISLLGFDDADWAPVVEPPITVVEQPAYEIGTRALQFLIERIENSAAAVRSELLPTKIIERGSIDRPPA